MESKFNIGDRLKLKGTGGNMTVKNIRIVYELEDEIYQWEFNERDLEPVVKPEKHLYFNKYKWIADRVKTMGADYVAMFTWPDTLHGKLAAGNLAVPEWCDERDE